MKQKQRKTKQKERAEGHKAAGARPKPPKVKKGRMFAVAVFVLLLAFIAGSALYRNQKSDEAV